MIITINITHRELNFDLISIETKLYFFRKVWKIERGILKFGIGLPDRSLGSYDSLTGKFTVPVNGRYRFELFIATYGGTGYYNIALRVGGLTTVRPIFLHQFCL